LALREIIPQAFKDREEPKENGEEFGRRFALNINDKAKKNKRGKETDQRYLLLTALGVYALHRIARDLLHLATKNSSSFNQLEAIKKILEPLQSFDWKANSSPLSALGGMKGVSKAYELLSETIGQERLAPILDDGLKKYS
jgi:hypothetical protein